MFANSKEGVALVMPAAIFTSLLFLVPVGILLSEAFRADGTWSLAGYGEFFARPLHVSVLLRTLKLGLLVTAAAGVIGYAVAFCIVNLGPVARGRVFLLVILPLTISPVAPTYAWIVILGRGGIVNDVFLWLGVVDKPIRLLFTETAIFLGLLQLFLPLMVISLVSAMENIPRDVIPAARILGANWMQVFVQVIVPLTKEGLVVGGTLVFSGSLTAYVTPAILGGSKILMLETLLYQRVTVGNDYVSASVITMILIAMAFAANLLLKRLATARKSV